MKKQLFKTIFAIALLITIAVLCVACNKSQNEEASTEMPEKIEGGFKVNSLTLKGGKTLAIDGIFLLKDSVSPSALVGGLQAENGHIVVNRACETNLGGLFAAGDCTGRPYQYAKAVGEGNVAAHSASEYITERKKK